MLPICAVRVYPRSPPSLLLVPLAATAANYARIAMSRSIRIAVVGDVHDQWDIEEDSKALHFLQPDLFLLSCDFGNENVELVRSIASLAIPKAAILGNHDCWRTYQHSQKKADNVQLQLGCLGELHVGYNHLDFPVINLSVVGGRPFSCGGESGLFRPRLLSARYGISDMEGSAKKIYEAALRIQDGHSVIILAHNGPAGLGSKINDICGRDWVYEGGDHGDPDLAQAISNLKTSTKISIPLVVFGHMHKKLAYGRGLRKMIVVGSDNTIYLNGAIVPRVKHCSQQANVSTDPIQSEGAESKKSTLRAFTLTELVDGMVTKVSETWVSVRGEATAIAEENVLFENP